MRARRTDANHRAVTEAIRALGMPVKSLHTQGGGVEDLLVGVTVAVLGAETKAWVLVEVKKVERESTGYIRHTPAQLRWYEQTQGFPRLVVTSPQDAVDKLRRMQG
jgi:hypothetical protein